MYANADQNQFHAENQTGRTRMRKFYFNRNFDAYEGASIN